MSELHNPGAERSLLAAMMLGNGAIERAAGLLNPSHFYAVAHGKMFAAICTMHTHGKPVDFVTLADELRQRGDLDAVGAIADVLDSAGTSANVPEYGRIIRDYAARRTHVRDLEAEIERTRNGGWSGGDTAPPDRDRLVRASLSGPAILDHVFEPRPSLLGNGIISAGDLVLIFGRAKGGKTWITLKLALAMAHGGCWFGFPTTSEPTPVGFLELELLGDSLQDRLRALVDDNVPMPETFHLVVRPALAGAFDLVNRDGEPVDLDELRAWIVAHGLKVVFVDALARATSCPQIDFSPLLLALDHLRADLGVAIVLIHHEGKPARDGGKDVDDLDAMRGDSRLSGFPQCVMRVVKKGGNLYAVHFAGVSNGPTPEPIYFTLDPKTGVPRLAKAPESVAADNLTRIFEAIRSAEQPLTRAEIEMAVGLKKTAVSHHVQALIEDGKVVTVGEGKETRYRVPASAASAASAEDGADAASDSFPIRKEGFDW